MAAITPDLYSDQVTAMVNTPTGAYAPLKPSELSGRMRIAYFYSKPTAAVAATKVMSLTKLPKNARVIGGRLKSNAWVATSTADVGLIGADGSGVIDNPTDATADSATFFTGGGTLAVATAGDYEFANTQANNYGYVLQKDCYLIMKLNTAGMDGSADIVTGHVVYVVD